MKKVLMCTGEEELFDKKNTMFYLNSPDIEVEHTKMFKSDKIINRIKRNIGIFAFNELNQKMKNSLEAYDALIIFDSVAKNKMIEAIRKNNPSLRIILYFRNQLSFCKKRNIDIDFLKKINVELWTYNYDDAYNYKMKYNSQFWNTEFKKTISKDEHQKIYDYVFMGREKGRIDYLKNIVNVCNKINLNGYIYLFPNTNYEFDKNKKNEYMNYTKYLNIVNKSKIIIDLVTKDNYGLTIRPLEAIFLNKKIITNYKQIKKYDFYSKDNIFIIDEDNISDLEDFIKKPYRKIDNKIIEKYDYNAWIKIFFQ